jgi:hypothetical protein
MATRVEKLAEEALAEVDRLEAALDPLTADDMAQTQWIETCCQESRDALADLMERIKIELEEAEGLLPGLGSVRASHARRYVRIAMENAGYLIFPSSFWSALERGNKDVVKSGFRVAIRHGILGCLSACVVDVDR